MVAFFTTESRTICSEANAAAIPPEYRWQRQGELLMSIDNQFVADMDRHGDRISDRQIDLLHRSHGDVFVQIDAGRPDLSEQSLIVGGHRKRRGNAQGVNARLTQTGQRANGSAPGLLLVHRQFFVGGVFLVAPAVVVTVETG